MKEAIAAVAKEIEDEGERTVRALYHMSSKAEAAQAAEAHANTAVARWQALYGELVVRFSDGWDYDSSHLEAAHVGYPSWWLKEVGYLKGTQACKTTCP